ncbi:uncharacterized protein FOMMEDRAFT_150347 [Fomitiporia mediterranea MF3/22]|uniref:uncharacterized protein n=1 Tax=Fomitiporia mediterranea (strain MF3/22) TaxID=694068 RepID=UPI0004408A10|nr:uncharacterized protein FOMMEDRAFT_150347 [Fomitiporia mediterranea MF3/22]EJD07796.1 hypothetical protein FOMMEDRAFT_150347 [Fomitiporia mediterranea MF3/22]
MPEATAIPSFPLLQTVHLRECDADFAYIDSGVPGLGATTREDYTTVVCIHGHTHHAQTFTRLFAPASQRNLRIIALNRRDYVGSTPFSKSEIAQLDTTDEPKHQQFLYDRGREIAYFLLWVINELKIPPARNDGKSGGLALLGWSLGNITSFAFLANLARYPMEVVETLDAYLRHFFVYEAVFQFLGFPVPPGAYHPLWDDSIPKEQKAYEIDVWFSSYFQHPYFSRLPTTRTRDLDSLQLRIPSNPARPPTIANKTTADDDATKDLVPGARSEMYFFTKFRDGTLHKQYEAALISENTTRSGPSRFLLPNLSVSVVDGSETVWNIIWAGWEVEKNIEKWKVTGAEVRPLKFITIEGSNHFLLWDDPELLRLRMIGVCPAGKRFWSNDRI